jgi:pimeloyl-ACP methyl ester carboxylesterase
MAASRCNANGIYLHHEIVGEGPPLLLISGLGGNSGVWATVVPLLKSHFRCITFDNRGAGRSDVPPGPYAIDQMADDAAALIDHLALGPVNAIGWSLGGSVLQSLLIHHSRVLGRAVLLNAFPSYTGAQHGWLDGLLALQSAGCEPVAKALYGMAWGFTPRFLADHAAVLAAAQYAASDSYPTSTAGWEAQAHGLRRYDSRSALPRVVTPTLVLTGAEDVLTPVDQSIEIARLIPRAQLRILPRGGHGMALEYTTDTVNAMLPFLQQQTLRDVS